MKRLLHSVAALMIGLVGLQPAVGLLCRAPAAPCPLAFSDVGPHCGAVSKADLDGSGQAAQVRPVGRSMASVALPANRKLLEFAVADAPAVPLPVRAALRFDRASASDRAESPPIYLRNRVFRI
jgi:hypothetical protein